MQATSAAALIGSAVNKARLMPNSDINGIISAQDPYNPSELSFEELGFFPKDSYTCKGAAYDYYGRFYPCNPWGGPINMSVENSMGEVRVTVRYGYMPKAACIRIATKVAGSVAGLTQIRDPYANVYIGSDGSNCVDGLNIYWVFKISP